jgi:hypothetical protein
MTAKDLPQRRDSSLDRPAVVRRYGMCVSLKRLLPISILTQLTRECKSYFQALEREAGLEPAKTGFADRRFDRFSISRKIWHTRGESNPESQFWRLLPSPSGRVCMVRPAGLEPALCRF